MKVLLFDKTLSFITPGGKTTHANKLYQELKKLGVDIEFAQWWNKEQANYDLIHTLAHQVEDIVDYSHSIGKKVILTHILDIETNKPIWKQNLEIIQNKIQSLFPFTMEKMQGVRAIPKFDHIVFMHKNDRNTALKYFPKIDIDKTSIIPHAYDPKEMGIGLDLKLEIDLPPKYLISCANIDWRKQSHLLAQYAKAANVPIVFIGGCNQNDSYYKEFINEVDNIYVFYLGYVDLKMKDYLEKNAFGFALLSLAESGCIAVFEAAAYNLPLFLSNLPWATSYEDPVNISLCDFKETNKAIEQLKSFYNRNWTKNKPPFKIQTWSEIAKRYKDLYEKVLNENP